MAESDFTIVGSAAASVARGVSAGFGTPNGGGNFVFGYHAKTADSVAVATYYDQTNFAPLRDDNSNPTGGSVRAAIKRGVSTGSSTGYSCGIFIGLQGTDTTDQAYMLGLADDDPSAIILAKTSPNVGLDPEASTTLLVSSDTYLKNTWVHIRLDMIVNPNGDVVLKCFENDLSSYTVDSPTWAAIDGMTDFIDDALGVNSGSNPMAGGYLGHFFHSELLGATGFIDQFEPHRQM